MTVIPDRRGYNPAPTCLGWTCPCGHHSISAVGPVPSCAKCGKHNPNRYSAERVRRNRKRRAEHLEVQLRHALSEPSSTLPVDVADEAHAS